MKKVLSIVFALLLVTVLVCPVFAASQPPLLVDEAELLSFSEAERLTETLEEISEEWDLDVVIVTVQSLDGEDIQDYADDWYDYGGYRPDGILLLVAMYDREVAISTKGKAIDIFTDSRIDRILDDVAESLSEEDYSEAFEDYADLCRDHIQSASEFSVGKSLLISVIIGFVVAFIATAVMKGQLKTVRAKPGASDYVKQGSMRLTQSRDLFLYSNVTRVPRPKSNSGGSSTHRSSSGSLHGGGRRSF